MQTVEASVRGLLPTGTRLTFVGLDYEAQLDEMVANNTRVFAGITFKTAGLPAKGDATTGTHDMGYQLRLPTDIPSTTRRENWMTEVNFPEWERIAPRILDSGLILTTYFSAAHHLTRADVPFKGGHAH